MGLHRHRIDHILPRCGIQRLENLLRQRRVLGPAQGVPLHPQHILHGRKGVKTQIGIDLVAVVEGARVVVDGVAGVALLLEGIVDRFTDVGLQNRLIGVFAGSEIVQAHTRQDFKFRVGRTRADGRHRQQPRGTEFFQRREIGHRVLGIGQSLEVFDIHKGLQLHRHNIGHDLRFGARGRRVRLLLFRLLLVQLVHHRTHFLRRIVLRLRDTPVEQAGTETVCKAVGVIGIAQVVKLGGQNAGAGEQHRSAPDVQSRRHAAEAGTQIVHRLTDGQLQKRHHQSGQNGQRDQHNQNHLERVQIDVQNTEHREDQPEIHGGQRCYPERHEHTFHHAQRNPEDGNQQQRKAAVAHQPHQADGQQDNPHAVKERHGSLH